MPIDRRAFGSFCAMLALSAFAIAGCGGNSSTGRAGPTGKSAPLGTTSGQGESTSPGKRFIALADRICHKVNLQLAHSSAKGKKRTGFIAALIRNETIERRAIGELAELAPPIVLAAAWRRVLGYRRSLANQLGALVAAMQRGVKASEDALVNSKKQVHRQLREVAGRARFKDCAKVG
jgi:hypothetical protein